MLTKIKFYTNFLKKKISKYGPIILYHGILYELLKGKKAVLPYPPRHATLTIGGYCTNKCIFCAYHNPLSGENKKTSHLYRLAYNLTLEQAEKNVDMFVENKIPLIHVVSEGEPFLHKNILEILGYVIEKSGDVTTQTNFNKPLFEKRKFTDEIIKRGDKIRYITTDLLSYNPELHNSIKAGSDFNYTLDCMERISKESGLFFYITYILTNKNYKGIDKLLKILKDRGINNRFSVINLDPYCLNDFTDIRSIYKSGDTEITSELDKARKYAEDNGLWAEITEPYDVSGQKCDVFWTQIQIGPSHKIPREKFHDNVYPRACMANAYGDIYTYGNLSDYKNIMDLWNNEYLVNIRKNLIKGIYPSYYCAYCKSCLKRDDPLGDGKHIPERPHEL